MTAWRHGDGGTQLRTSSLPTCIIAHGPLLVVSLLLADVGALTCRARRQTVAIDCDPETRNSLGGNMQVVGHKNRGER